MSRKGSVKSRCWRDSDVFFASLQVIQEQGEGMLLGENEEGEIVPIAMVVNPRPSPIKHFAMYPKQLIEPMIKATTPEAGVCSACAAPYQRKGDNTTAIKWASACACLTGIAVPASILDPFAGTGTTGVNASALGRRATLIDLDPRLNHWITQHRVL